MDAQVSTFTLFTIVICIIFSPTLFYIFQFEKEMQKGKSLGYKNRWSSIFAAFLLQGKGKFVLKSVSYCKRSPLACIATMAHGQ